jgi:hypothetical protein
MTPKHFRRTFPCVSLNTGHIEIAQVSQMQESWVGGKHGLDTSLAKNKRIVPVQNTPPAAWPMVGRFIDGAIQVYTIYNQNKLRVEDS